MTLGGEVTGGRSRRRWGTARLVPALLLASSLGCGPKSLDARMKAADKYSDKLGAKLDDAERALGQLEPKQAEEPLEDAKEILAEPELQLSPEREMLAGRYAELVAKLPAVREARRQRDIEEAVRAERADIGPSLQAMKDAAEAIAGPKVDAKLIDAARASVASLEKAVAASDDRRALANQDPSFGGYLKRAKAETEKARAELTRAERKLKFLEGPAALKDKANDELGQVKKEKDVEKKRALLTSAAGGFAQCQTAGLEFTKGGGGSEKVVVGGSATTFEALLGACKTAQQSTEQALAKLPKPKPAPAPKKKK